MRSMISALVVIGAISTAAPVNAQTYSPDYPVCLHVWGRAEYYECGYTSMAQCNATASGRAAQCVPNPYLAYAAPPVRTSKRVRPVY
jgi:Protein of unknown function (DUF3551)